MSLGSNPFTPISDEPNVRSQREFCELNARYTKNPEARHTRISKVDSAYLWWLRNCSCLPRYSPSAFYLSNIQHGRSSIWDFINFFFHLKAPRLYLTERPSLLFCTTATTISSPLNHLKVLLRAWPICRAWACERFFPSPKGAGFLSKLWWSLMDHKPFLPPLPSVQVLHPTLRTLQRASPPGVKVFLWEGDASYDKFSSDWPGSPSRNHSQACQNCIEIQLKHLRGFFDYGKAAHLNYYTNSLKAQALFDNSSRPSQTLWKPAIDHRCEFFYRFSSSTLVLLMLLPFPENLTPTLYSTQSEKYMTVPLAGSIRFSAFIEHPK